MSTPQIIVDSSKVSFRHFSKSTVFKHLRDATKKGDFEETCHWTTEIDLSDWQVELFDFFFTFSSTYLLTTSPKIAVYLNQKYEFFKSIYYDTRLSAIKLHQNQMWKDLWVECLGVLVFNTKEEDLLSLSRIELYQLENLVQKVKTYPIHTWLHTLPESTSRDPIHQFLVRCASLLLLHLETKSLQEALTTLSCIFEYESYMKNEKSKMTCITREIPQRFNDSFTSYKSATKSTGSKKDPCKQDWIWVIWDALELMVSNLHSKRLYQDPVVPYDLLVHTIHSLRGFFELGFHSISQRKDRLCFLVRAMTIISNFNSASPSWKAPILDIESAKMVKIATKNIHVMYGDIISSIHQPTLLPVAVPNISKMNIGGGDTSSISFDASFKNPISLERRPGSSLLNTVSVDKLNVMERLDPFL